VALRARLIQERGGDSLSPVVFSLISFEAGTGRPRLPSPPLFVRILESAVRCGRSEASAWRRRFQNRAIHFRGPR